jgi:hypothetical protein
MLGLEGAASSVAIGQPANFNVFDASGRRVKTLLHGVEAA